MRVVRESCRRRELWGALYLVLLLALFGTAHAEPPTAQRLENLALKDVDGGLHAANSWRQHRAVLLLFIATECPVSNGYSPEMQRIAHRYAKDDVACFGVHCDATVTAETARAHAKDYGLKFPILLDPAQSLAAAVGARITPEAVVLSPQGEVLYRGRIDNKYTTDGKRRDEPSVFDLRAALNAVLSGRPPKIAVTEPFGCPLPKPLLAPAGN